MVPFQICMGFPDSSLGKESALQYRRPWFDSWVGKICWRRDRLPTPVFLGFPCGSVGKEPACNVGDLGLIPGLGRSPGEGKGYPLQYSGLENSMNCIVHGIAKSQTRLSDFHFHLNLLIPNFQSFSPFPHSPLATVNLFSMSVILFLFHRYVHLCRILDSTCK